MIWVCYNQIEVSEMPYSLYIIIGYVFYVLSIVVHVLVIQKKISYKLINGGRSESYEAQRKISIVSVGVLVIGLSVLISYHVWPEIVASVAGMIVMGMLSIYWLLGLFMQFMGTLFEKKFMVPIVILGIFSHVMIFVQYFV